MNAEMSRQNFQEKTGYLHSLKVFFQNYLLITMVFFTYIHKFFCQEVDLNSPPLACELDLETSFKD